MKTPDWKKAELLLVKESSDAIQAFAAEHPGVECCHFAFDSEPRYGYVLIGFDSTTNSLKSAQTRENYAISRRTEMLSEEEAWRDAEYFLNTPVLVPFGDNTGDFEFQFFRECKFPEWQEYAESTEYPAERENENDYLEGNFRILVWRVVESLIASDAFNCLKKSKPFLISYGLHDQEQRILRILNWPQIS
jgi:hypothetical protein